MSQLALFPDEEAPVAPIPFDPFVAITGGEVLHVGPVEVIGKHEWCVVIYHDAVWDRRSLFYAWRRAVDVQPNLGDWRHHRDWPSYDHNRYDGGCPLSLRVLWDREADARRAFGVDDGERLP